MDHEPVAGLGPQGRLELRECVLRGGLGVLGGLGRGVARVVGGQVLGRLAGAGLGRVALVGTGLGADLRARLGAGLLGVGRGLVGRLAGRGVGVGSCLLRIRALQVADLVVEVGHSWYSVFFSDFLIVRRWYGALGRRTRRQPKILNISWPMPRSSSETIAITTSTKTSTTDQ